MDDVELENLEVYPVYCTGNSFKNYIAQLKGYRKYDTLSCLKKYAEFNFPWSSTKFI